MTFVLMTLAATLVLNLVVLALLKIGLRPQHIDGLRDDCATGQPC